jgi:hypothetical protein
LSLSHFLARDRVRPLLGVIVALGLVSVVALRGPYAFGVTPIPLRSNPVWLGLSLLLFPVAILVFYARGRLPLATRDWRPEISIFVLAFGLLVCALFPGSGNYAVRDRVSSEAPVLGRTATSIFILFDNNSDQISPAEAARLRDALAVYRDCEMDTLLVRGFASSATFADQSDDQNLSLSNRRGLAVAALMSSIIGRHVDSTPWPDYPSMVEYRRVRDTDEARRRLIESERFNRRAEIYWTDRKCLPQQFTD